MATNDVLKTLGLQLLFADHATDFGAAPATAANSIIIGSPTDVQMDLTGLAASGGARASDKLDATGFRGSVWGSEWNVHACLEHETAPVDGETVDFYWASSPSTTDGTGNVGGLSGSDATFTDTGGILGQMEIIGSLVLRANVINIGKVGIIYPKYQWGQLVVVNQSTKTLRSTATAMDETHITITEIIDQVQAAV